MDTTRTATHIADLFGGYHSGLLEKKRTASERSELVRYFFENAKTGWIGKRPLSPAFVAMKLSHLSIQDLYAFKSMCEDRKRGGYPFGKFFWGSLKSGKREWEQQG